MCEFFVLNKRKLTFGALVTWLLFGFLLTIIVFFYIGSDRPISFLDGLGMTAIYATFTTCLMLMIAISFGGYEFIKKKRVFARPEWNSYFSRNNFQTIQLYKHTRWVLTEEAKTGYIKGFPVLADMKKDYAGYVVFMFFADSRPLDKPHFRELEKFFKKHDGGFEVGYIYKKLKRNRKLSDVQIEKELLEFADLLLKEGFTPRSNTV
jgi:hypothetical protein